MVRQITLGKQNRTFLVVLSPVVQIPTELEKLMVVVEHGLPRPKATRAAIVVNVGRFADRHGRLAEASVPLHYAGRPGR